MCARADFVLQSKANRFNKFGSDLYRVQNINTFHIDQQINMKDLQKLCQRKL
jgi:hypothetical protein